MRPSHRFDRFTAAISLVIAAALALAGAARADGPQAEIRGMLIDAKGHPVDQPTLVTFRVYATATGGEPLVAAAQRVRAVKGSFATILGEGVLGAAKVRDLESLWVSSQAENGPECQHRTHLVFAPNP